MHTRDWQKQGGKCEQVSAEETGGTAIRTNCEAIKGAKAAKMRTARLRPLCASSLVMNSPFAIRIYRFRFIPPLIHEMQKTRNTTKIMHLGMCQE